MKRKLKCKASKYVLPSSKTLDIGNAKAREKKKRIYIRASGDRGWSTST